MSGGKSSPEDQREQRLKLIEDHIGQHLRQAEAMGELKSAPSHGTLRGPAYAAHFKPWATRSSLSETS